MDFLDEEFEQILNIFREESEEILERINVNLLKLEQEPTNKDYIFQLFRDAHSLKGASRMVGFLNIQSIAHKIEDILGLCKENKLELNKSICDILLKSVDFLWLLVKNSIQLKADFSTNDISYYQSALQNIIDNPSVEPIKLDSKKVFSSAFNDDIPNINAILLEVVFLSSTSIDTIEKIVVIKELYEKLFESFSKTDYFDIKQTLDDIISKLKFVMNATGILVDDEIIELRSKTKNIIDMYLEILKNYDVELPNDYFYSLNDKTDDAKSVVEESENVQVVDAFKVLFEEFDKISKKCFNPHNIITKFNLIAYETEDLTIKKVCGQLVDFFNLYLDNKINIDSELENILKQTLRSLEGIVCNKLDFKYDDINLLEQRVTILFQILDLESLKNPVGDDKLIHQDKSFKILNKNFDLKTLKQSSLPNLEANVIKTLRIDSGKLDKLANSISELVINKVKYSSQLNSLSELVSNNNDLKNLVAKSLNYIKYFGNKINELNGKEDIDVLISEIEMFEKHLIYLFSEVNNKNILSKEAIDDLYASILEDNSKNIQILDEIENDIKEIRILPLATIFHMFPRMVRDLAYENGKDIDLEIIGNEISVDKKIVEEIKNPLIHILRNAIDHGIETTQERIKSGKDSTGKIVVKAYREYNKIVIEIADDGRGINLNKVKEKALEKGLLTSEEINVMSDEQIMNVIFYPGFSTEEVVTELSGRGVGLDIVQTKIAQLNGKVKISSVVSKGSLLRLELPITTATINTFTFKINKNYYAIPVDVISSLYMIKPHDIFQKGNSSFVIINDESISVFWISDILGIEQNKNELKRLTLIVINDDNRKIGYIINSLESDEEVILRKFTPPLFKLKNFAGITTLLNGSTCLILNMADIIKNTFVKNPITLNSYSEFIEDKQEKKHKILLLDDSATSRNLLKNQFKDEIFEVELAPLPSIAFELVKEKMFDLIITDIEMPEMNGLEFVEKLKEFSENKETPVIIFSSFKTDEFVEKAQQLGVKQYFLKSEFNNINFVDIAKSIIRESDVRK